MICKWCEGEYEKGFSDADEAEAYCSKDCELKDTHVETKRGHSRGARVARNPIQKKW